MPNPDRPQVRHLRQVLLWPLRLMPLPAGAGSRPWELLTPNWREVVDEYTGDAEDFHERHYNEFVTFLPYVQRFLYGDGRAQRDAGASGSPMRVFRRRDVAQVRFVSKPGDAPLVVDIVHVDLYFFLNIDLVMLNVEVSANELPLAQAQDLLYRFGRAYPAGWDAAGQALHCMDSVEFLDADGRVLARSDAQARELFLEHVSEHRAPRISAHWAFMLEPLVSDHSGRPGALRFRQIEYYRMPTMAYLALDEPRALTRSDFVRLGLLTAAPEGDNDGLLPYAEPQLADFEQRHCYDRFWSDAGAAPNTRYLCSGHSLVVVGDARAPFYNCAERGVLAQFRHQHFLLFLIAHFQKAALLMFSDRLAEALKHLDIADPDSIRRFKRAIRDSFAGFLGFTHRYWFHEVSEQAQARALFRMCTAHLEHRRALCRGQGTHRRHERLPRSRQPAPPGQHRGAADGGDDLRPDRHRHHRLPGHEPAGRGRCADGAAAGAVRRGLRRHRGADDLHHGQVETAVGLSGCAVGRTAGRVEQGQGLLRRVAARR